MSWNITYCRASVNNTIDVRNANGKNIIATLPLN